MTDNYNELAGHSIAGCELLKELGRGTNGIVYLANRKKLSRQVACKIIYGELQNDPDFIDNLFSEASNAAKLSHPNIIQALDVGDDNGVKYFLMEYINGSSLEYIRTNTPEIISTEYLLDIAVQLANAMDYAWRQHGMIHGDIKPANILISKEKVLKVGDLGLARSSNGATGDPADIMITPLYAAPEIISQQALEPDQRSDIYSFGTMLYELLCGSAPFSGSIEYLLECHLSHTPDPLISRNPDMNRELAEFIDSMLAKNPDDRPKDWQVVRERLQEIYRKLFPEAEVPGMHSFGQAKKSNSVNTFASNSSWNAEKKELKLLEKFPWLLPALLIVIIVAALISIPISMRLF
ncbi:MAG: serine/threonine protein kinase [Lentisphaeria bacterium]|nr:serine/threonine protein kinase [Lentisphaeria bacterium]